MSIFEHHTNKEYERQQYWVEYYKKHNIVYVPSKGRIKWDYLVYDLTFPDDGYICNRAVEFLLSEFEILRKNVCSYSQAIDYWIGVCNNQGIKCTRENIKEAYDLAYGYGCEFEFSEI